MKKQINVESCHYMVYTPVQRQIDHRKMAKKINFYKNDNNRIKNYFIKWTISWKSKSEKYSVCKQKMFTMRKTIEVEKR